jgi:hypothetical protein
LAGVANLGSNLEGADDLNKVFACESVAAADPTEWDAPPPSLLFDPPLGAVESFGDLGWRVEVGYKPAPLPGTAR